MSKEKRKLLSKNARIGIVNRGEAAVRFIGAVREYNILNGTEMSTVAFYIEAERSALFVKLADKSIPLRKVQGYEAITGSPYLNYQLIINALKETECEGVWVGWGFVSEDDKFCKMVEDAGLVFIGPSSQAMASLGDKVEAKKLAEKAKVPVLPWCGEPLKDAKDAHDWALKIGLPIMLKAANGGGGRGIRPVRKIEELEALFNTVTEESLRFTGKASVFMEALVEEGRHLEVQAIGDQHKNVLTFGVRDCSVQRNNQKIIEETPPINLDPAIIKEIEDAASRLILEANYWGAGTVEYIYDVKRKRPFFMEVNTRLQVEHPITEQLHSVDLVGLQLDVAMGKDIKKHAKKGEGNGYTIEVRLNAEDPDKKFMPSPGEVTLFLPPRGPGVRVDSGIAEGSTIPSDFDSMVAKIMAQAPTREQALARLLKALKELRIKIEGGTTNRAFLMELLQNEQVRLGGVSTNFIEKWMTSGKDLVSRQNWELGLVSGAIYQYYQKYTEEYLNFTRKVGLYSTPRNVSKDNEHTFRIASRGEEYLFTLKRMPYNFFHIEVDGKLMVFRYEKQDDGAVLYDGETKHHLQVVKRGEQLQCEVDGIPYPLELDSQGAVTALSPSVVLKVPAKVGEEKKKGDLLVVLEAMKMEMTVLAPFDGTIKSIPIREGEQVSAGQVLMEMEKKAETSAADAQAAAPKNTSARVTFERFAVDKNVMEKKHPGDYWRYLKREYYAVFTGYDFSLPIQKNLEEMGAFVRRHPEYLSLFQEVLIKGICTFVDIEKLFSKEQLKEEGVSRTSDYAELLMHYFLRREKHGKGMPAKFLEVLEKVVVRYRLPGMRKKELSRRVLYRIFRSHSYTQYKMELVLLSLFKLQMFFPKRQDIKPIDTVMKALEEIVEMVDEDSIRLIDAAFHTRYLYMDKGNSQDHFKERREKLQELFENVVTAQRDSSQYNDLKNEVIDSWKHTTFDIVETYFEASPEKKKIAVELLGRRYNRDREFLSGYVTSVADKLIYHMQCTDEEATYHSVVVVVPSEELIGETMDVVRTYLKKLADDKVEVLFFVKGLKCDEKYCQLGEPIEKKILEIPLPVESFCVGVFFYENRQIDYRTFNYINEDWKENIQLKTLSPLKYRECRVSRLKNFNLTLLDKGEHLHLFRLVGKNNTRDNRLFAFLELPTIRIDEVSKSGRIEKVAGLEEGLLEAVQSIRLQQSKQSKRFHWNRIIVHVRPVIQHDLARVNPSSTIFTSLLRDLGLEKFVIYYRYQNPMGGAIEAREVIFDSLNTPKVSVRTRPPSRAPMRLLNSYDNKVVQCFQRGLYYPYQIIRMISRVDLYGDQLRKGEFIEYDVEIDAKTGESLPVSVEGRPFGQNTNNTVFGIINKFIKGFEGGLKRVIILGDPSSDLGALGESECRAILAAFTLARREQLPVEWIPVSSGARIEMNSGTENLDWTARVLKDIIEFTQAGGEVNIVVNGINVGAQSYWNSEATMLMHTRGLLIMTDKGSMLLTGKKALDFSGSVSAEDSESIGGGEKIMGPNGQAQILVKNLTAAYRLLSRHYEFTYSMPGEVFPRRRESQDPIDRNVCLFPYKDTLAQGFTTIGDILGVEKNRDRKRPFDIRQVMKSVIDQDGGGQLERWEKMVNAETAVVWETRIGGFGCGLIGIESRSLRRPGAIPNDGPESWSGGTLFPMSSKKVARAINAFSRKLPVVVLANLSGFDGSPESLRRFQLEFGAEIGRAVVNFQGPLIFVVISRYHGGAYVVFSRTLNENLQVVALTNTFASVIGGAPAAAVVFPRLVQQNTLNDEEVVNARQRLESDKTFSQKDYDVIYQEVFNRHQVKVAQQFDSIHSIERAQKVGSVEKIIAPESLRPFLVGAIEAGMKKFLAQGK